MLFSLFLMTVSAAVSAQSGSTEIRAHIEAETVQTSEPAQPLPTAPEPSSDSPVRTGEQIALFAFAVLAFAGSTIVLVCMKNRTEN